MSVREADATIDVTRLIDDGPVTSYQVMAIVLCSAVALLDGIDSQSIALAAPLMIEKMGRTRAALGPVFSAGLFGAMLGALTFGPLGDRFGRKRMLILAACIFGIFTMATALADQFGTLVVVRFLAGLGLGGATPCFITLASEYAPRRRRAMVASLIWAAFPIGGSLGGFVNGALLQHYGWHVMFLIGGALPIVIAAVLAVWLPESLRYLLTRGAPAARIAAIMQRLHPDPIGAARFVTEEETMRGLPFGQLFRDGRAGVTLLLWVPFFVCFGILGIAVVWAPVLMREHGLPPGAAGTALGIHGIGALIGIASAGRLIEKFGALPVLLPAMLLGALCTAMLGYAATSVASISAVLFLIGLFVGMSASGSIALATLTYPTVMRASGVGWAMGMGRFGQVLAPLVTTSLIGLGWSGGQIFALFGLGPILAALAILALRRTTPRGEPVVTLAPG